MKYKVFDVVELNNGSKATILEILIINIKLKL